MIERSIPEVFFRQVARYGDRTFLRQKRAGRWQELSWRELAVRVRNAAKGLIALGFAAGERACIISENRPEWVIADLATLCAAGADAPIYPTSTPAQTAYIVRDAGARFVFSSTAEQLDKVLRVRAELPELVALVSFDPGVARAPGVLTLAELEAKGAASGLDAELDARLAALGRDSLLTLIYTSGTTGDPKGVMLTHANVLDNCTAATAAVTVLETDSFLSFLPLCHSFERTAGYYTAMTCGIVISYAESLERIVDNIAETRPTILCSVPRVYEKVYGRFMDQVASARGAKKALLRWALRVGDEVARRLERRERPAAALAAQYAVARRLVFSKLADKLGGRLRFCVSGGAPLSGEIARFFLGAGILVLEGYGMTETSPLVTINRPDDFRFGSVGKVVEGVELRLAGDGELLVRGHNVMQGYWRKPEETKATLVGDGWLATGDIGHLDDDGFLWITDRKKDLIKTAGGKYVAPQELENLLKLRPWVEQVHVLGDRRPYCVAVIVPRLEALRAWATQHGLGGATDAELVADPRVLALVQADVDVVNARLARYQTIKRFVLTAEAFSLENGQLTPTLKVKRKAVNERYARQIEALYEGARDEGEGRVPSPA
jgi:long-chain acyl-CoA synthetase